MPEGDPLFWQLMLQVILIALNATFACAEIAVISVNEAKIQKLATGGDKRASRLLSLVESPARFLSTIQVGITLGGLLGAAFAADNFSQRIVNWLIDLGISIPQATLEGISVVGITLILSYFMLVFGELVPKRLAMKNAEGLAMAMSGMVYLLAKLFTPIVFFLTLSTNAMLRLFGVDPHAEDEEATEEEIRLLLDSGGENGSIPSEEREMIKNVFEFNDKTAEDVMTHRIEVAVLWVDESLEQWEETISESRHTRYPVCHENTDDVVGVINIKDYYRLKEKGFDHVKKEAVTPAFFVPDTIRADVLFRDMQKKRNHFAVVLDEYGGMCGIVTISDLIEEIVGDIDDGDVTDRVEPTIERLDSNTWKIIGNVPLDEVAEVLEAELPIEDYETFGGLVFGVLNSIPEDGSKPSFEAFGLTVKVEEIKDHRVELAIVCKSEAPASEQAPSER